MRDGVIDEHIQQKPTSPKIVHFLLLMLYVGLWCEAAVAGSYVMDEKGEREEGSKNK